MISKVIANEYFMASCGYQKNELEFLEIEGFEIISTSPAVCIID